MREGLFYERFFDADEGEPPMFENVRRAAVMNLAHLYRFQEHHAEHIAHLTLSMFDQMPAERLLCGAGEREILWAASMLHDIGVSVDYHDHHKHGSYLIINAGLPAYTHREIALIALLVRYHRKGKPTPDELAGLLDVDDEVRLLQMCAFLRLAEQFDRARDSMVTDVRLSVNESTAHMELITRGDETVALWSADRHRDIFEQAFGLPLELVAVLED